MQGKPRRAPLTIHSARARFRCPPGGVKQLLLERSLQDRILAPSPQSHSFSRSYGTILPTSLGHLTLSTRGCSPRRPDAVMGTDGRADEALPRLFKGRRKRTGCLAARGTRPDSEPSLPASCFQGPKLLNRNENTPRRFRQWRRVRLCCHTISTSRWWNINHLSFHRPSPRRLCEGLPCRLGPTNPCPNAVHMETFSSSVFKVRG